METLDDCGSVNIVAAAQDAHQVQVQVCNLDRSTAISLAKDPFASALHLYNVHLRIESVAIQSESLTVIIIVTSKAMLKSQM